MQNRIRRSDFLAGGLVAGGAALAGGVVAGRVATGDAAELSAQDARALQLILLVEYTEDAFYRQAIERDALQGELRVFARQVAGQERQHLDFARKALGGQADPVPASTSAPPRVSPRPSPRRRPSSRIWPSPPTTDRPPT
jgi:hypothetical protein